jgi:hypothetical protein
MLALKTGNTIADSGATQIFVIEGTPVIIKRVTTNPLTVSLANGHQVLLTHMCDIYIESLPFPLTWHNISDLSIASIFGIHVLTKVGCKDTFSKTTRVVKYNGNIIVMVWECVTAAWKALSRANAKRTGTNGWVIRSLD